MHREPRNATIEKIVVHTNEGPEGANSAHGLAGFLNRIEGGYHKEVDDTNVVTTADDNEVVWGASGMNQRGLHVCVIGRAGQTAEEWHDPFSQAAIRNTAIVVATWCVNHSIPVVKLTPEQVAANGVRGICGHVDVERSGLPYTGGVSGHWDPGPNFPWDEFIALVSHMLGDPVPVPHSPSPQEDDVPKPTDVTGVLETKHGLWHLHADGGVFTYRGQFWGSYPGLPAQYHEKQRVFYSIRARRNGKPGYVCVSADGRQYEFGK